MIQKNANRKKKTIYIRHPFPVSPCKGIYLIQVRKKNNPIQRNWNEICFFSGWQYFQIGEWKFFLFPAQRGIGGLAVSV